MPRFLELVELVFRFVAFDDILNRLRAKETKDARARFLSLDIRNCSHVRDCDPRLAELETVRHALDATRDAENISLAHEILGALVKLLTYPDETCALNLRVSKRARAAIFHLTTAFAHRCDRCDIDPRPRAREFDSVPACRTRLKRNRKQPTGSSATCRDKIQPARFAITTAPFTFDARDHRNGFCSTIFSAFFGFSCAKYSSIFSITTDQFSSNVAHLSSGIVVSSSSIQLL